MTFEKDSLEPAPTDGGVTEKYHPYLLSELHTAFEFVETSLNAYAVQFIDEGVAVGSPADELVKACRKGAAEEADEKLEEQFAWLVLYAVVLGSELVKKAEAADG